MLVMDPGRVRSIAAPWGHSNAIEPHVAWVISAVATLVVIAAVVVAEVWVALAAAEVFREEEVVDFEEVAVADGDVGRFRSGGDFPTREPRSRLGKCHARAHDTQEAAAAHSTLAVGLDMVSTTCGSGWVRSHPATVEGYAPTRYRRWY